MTTYRCPLCPRIETSRDKMRTHVDDAHGFDRRGVRLRDDRVLYGETLLKIVCHKCGQTSSDAECQDWCPMGVVGLPRKPNERHEPFPKGWEASN